MAKQEIAKLKREPERKPKRPTHASQADLPLTPEEADCTVGVFGADFAGAGEFIAASLGLGTVLEVKARRTLFPVTDMVTATPHRNWDISPDGQSFAMVRFNPATRIMVIQQLPALVARLQGAPR